MPNAIVYIVPTDASPLRLSAVTEEGNVYRKELIYVGVFEKKEDDLKFAVDEPMIDHWVSTFAKMKANGIKVPLPIKHTNDVEANRGETLDMMKGINQFGLPALYADIKFRDAEAEKLALTANCSIYVPAESVDGQGNVYPQPIAHIALTDYPVIPKLDNFTIIAASLTATRTEPEPKPQPKEIEMSFGKSLVKALQIEGIADDADDATIEKAVVDRFAAISKTTESPEVKPVAAGFITLARDNRQGKLDGLVLAGNITRATADEFKSQYCSDTSLALALSHDGTSNDGFDSLILTLAKNVPTGLNGGATGVQADVLKLSKEELMTDKNPLVANAVARAKAASN